MADKTFDELVADGIIKMQVKATVGRDATYQSAAFEVALQSADLKRKVAKHNRQTTIADKLDERIALHEAVQSRLATNPSLLMALNPSEAKRQARLAEKQAELSAKAVVAAAPCADTTVATAPVASTTSTTKAKANKGKSATA